MRGYGKTRVLQGAKEAKLAKFYLVGADIAGHRNTYDEVASRPISQVLRLALDILLVQEAEQSEK